MTSQRRRPDPPPPPVSTTTRIPWVCILSVAMLLTIIELVAMYLLSPNDSSSAMKAVIPFVPTSIAAPIEKPPPPPLPSEEFTPRALRERLLRDVDGRRREEGSSSSSRWWIRVDVSEDDEGKKDRASSTPSSRRSSDVAVYRVYDPTIDRCFGDDGDDGAAAMGGNSTEEASSSSGQKGGEGGGGNGNGGPGNPIPVPPATANSGSGSGNGGDPDEEDEGGEGGGSTSFDGDVLPPLLDGDRLSYYGVGLGGCSDATKSDRPSPSIEREYMIATGGFTDDDWSAFPVWAFDMTAAALSSSSSAGRDDEGEVGKEGKGGGPWTDLSGKGVGARSSSFVADGDGDDKKMPSHQWPRGRVGHVSAVHDGVLHVFGGLVWEGKAFRTEELCPPPPPAAVIDRRGNETKGGGGGEADVVDGTTSTMGSVPCVWRARIDDRLPRREKREDDNGGDDAGGLVSAEAEIASANATTTKEQQKPEPPSSSTPLRWERVSPKVITYYERQRRRGRRWERRTGQREGEAGIDFDEEGEDEEEREPAIVDVEYAENYYDDEERREMDIIEARKRLSRGEARGGYWESRSSLVFYGGLHPAPIAPDKETEDEEDDVLIDDDAPLGDVWRYDCATETFVQLSPYPPPPSQRDPRTGRHPRARTAHAATIVGDVLLIYGGMALSSDSKRHPYSGYSNYDSATGRTQNWDALTDLWAFDLRRERWIQRDAVPYLARSYHSLTGWGDGSVAAYGGFRTARTVGGEPIAFVFSDTLVNRPSDPRWYKAAFYLSEDAHGPSNRLEHAATTTKDGSMLVWGGRFKTVGQLFGVWSLRVFGPASDGSTVAFERATPDGLEAYEAELEALHLLVAVMLFMTVLFTALYGTLRRQAEELNQAQVAGGGVGIAGVVQRGNAGMGILGRRRTGLSREAIDALPIKRYGRTRSGGEEGVAATASALDGERRDADLSGADAADPSLGENGHSDHDDGPLDLVEGAEAEAKEEHEVDHDEEEDCCPICLVEYEEGEEVRTLPCGHEFHVGCIDPWLEGRTSCPACRASLSSRSAPRRSSGGDDDDGEDSPPEEEQGPGYPWEGGGVDLSTILPSLALPYAFGGGGGERRRWSLPIDELDDAADAERDPSPRDPATSPRVRLGPRHFFRSIGDNEMDDDDDGDGGDRDAWALPRRGFARRVRRFHHVGLPPPQSRRRGRGDRRSTRRRRSGMEMVTLNLSALEEAEEVPELV